MKVIGIDPGLSGGLAVITNSGELEVIDMPVYMVKVDRSVKRYLDRKRILSFLRSLNKFETIAFLEKQQAYPSQGSVSNYSTGFEFGVLVTCFDALELSYELVHPKTWQKEFSIRGGTAKKETKGMSTQIAEQLFPRVSFRGPNGAALDGRSDAALIAEWGKRRVNAGNRPGVDDSGKRMI